MLFGLDVVVDYCGSLVLLLRGVVCCVDVGAMCCFVVAVCCCMFLLVSCCVVARCCSGVCSCCTLRRVAV